MPSLNCSSSLEVQVLLLQYLSFQTASTIYSWYLSMKSTDVFFVLAACKISYAGGLKQIQLSADYS